MSGSAGMVRRLSWIEASLRFAGHFGAAEKKAYRDRFDLTDGMVSRDQDSFLRSFNDAGGSGVIKERGRLRLVDAAALPPGPFFPPLPKTTDWLEDVFGPHFEMVPPVRRAEPSHAVLREVVQALSERRPLRFHYQPRHGSARIRHVSPHVIVHVAGRLHLRGWDHERNAPRDFVLSRIVAVGQPGKLRGYVGQEYDREWSETVRIEVLLREGEELAAVRPDYNLDEFGRGTRRVRKALARYLVDEGSLNNDHVYRAPVAVQVRERG